MNKFILKKCRSIILVLLIIPMLMLSFNSQKASAVVGADDAVVIDGIVVTSEMITALVGCTLVAGGATLYANTDSTDLKYIADGLIATGKGAQDLSVQIDNTGKQFLSWTKDGIGWFSNKISTMVSDGYSFSSVALDTNISSVSSYTTIGKSVSVPYYISPTISLLPNSTLSVYIKMYYGSTGGHSYTNTSTSSQDVSFGMYYNTSNYAMVSDYVDGVALTNWFAPEQSSIISIASYHITGGGSICVPLGQAVKDYNDSDAQDVIGSDNTNTDGSISYQPKVGIPLTDSKNKAADGTEVYTPDVSVPYGQSWGNISGELGITYATQTGDTTDNGDDIISNVDGIIDYIMDDTIDTSVTTGAAITPNSGDVDEAINNIINGATETTNGKGIARNFEKSGGFEQTLKDFEYLKPSNIKNIQTKYGEGKVGKLGDGTIVVARPGSETGGATLEIKISNNKIYKVRY